MSVTIRKINAKAKDPVTGELKEFGLFGSDALEVIETKKQEAVAAVTEEKDDFLAAIQDKGEEYLESIEDKGETTLASIPNDYTELANDVNDLKGDLSEIEEEIEGISGLSDDAKTALLNCFQHVAWVDEHGKIYYDALVEALDYTVWDYEWYASSDGTLPPNMTVKPNTAPSYDTVTQSLEVDAPILNFEYVGDCVMEIVCSAPAEEKTRYNPRFNAYIRYAGNGTGIEGLVFFSEDSERKVSATVIENDTYTKLDVDQTEFHKYKMHVKNGTCEIYIDDVLAGSGWRVSNGARACGIYTPQGYGESCRLNIKSIKFKMTTDWYEQHEWCYPGNLTLVNTSSGMIQTENGTEPAMSNEQDNRSSFWVMTGEQSQDKVINYQTMVRTENIYSIPVPDNATKISVQITPETYYANVRFFHWKEDTNEWINDIQTNWQLGSISNYPIPEMREGYTRRYIIVNTKYNTSGTSGDAPTGIDIVFSDE